MGNTHTYALCVQWTGNRGEGTASYRSYDRDHTVMIEGKPELSCSSDPAFLGDASRYNPEDLLLASLSTCHMLWYLHLCADAGVIITAYKDKARGVMEQTSGGKIRFTFVTLKPVVTVTDARDIDKARALHHDAHDACFIANSVNFPVNCQPLIGT